MLQEFIPEAQRRLKGHMRGGKSVQKLASLIDIEFIPLHGLIYDGIASDQTVGRVLSWLDSKRSSEFKRKLQLVQSYKGLPRELWKMEEALWLEITKSFKRSAAHPIHWQNQPYEYRKIMCLRRELWAKKLLLNRVIDLMPIRGVYLRDGYHYFHWKEDINRALNPDGTREQWLSLLPDSPRHRTHRLMPSSSVPAAY